tara:strand:- start:105 stop:287 length:183 start_codon:yes stop_codon:yes gene_type:complete
MGKKKKAKKKELKKLKKKQKLSAFVNSPVELKTKCCDKYKKKASKRCKKCPCFDLLQKVA